jgi:hypothetical protein
MMERAWAERETIYLKLRDGAEDRDNVLRVFCLDGG